MCYTRGSFELVQAVGSQFALFADGCAFTPAIRSLDPSTLMRFCDMVQQLELSCKTTDLLHSTVPAGTDAM